MSAVKTAISLEADLLERVDRLAKELEIPRSRLLARAAEDLVGRYENRRLLRDLDAAYGEDESSADPEETRLRKAHKARHRRRLEGEW